VGDGVTFKVLLIMVAQQISQTTRLSPASRAQFSFWLTPQASAASPGAITLSARFAGSLDAFLRLAGAGERRTQ
jgi:hypothetical protein